MAPQARPVERAGERGANELGTRTAGVSSLDSVRRIVILFRPCLYIKGGQRGRGRKRRLSLVHQLRCFYQSPIKASIVGPCSLMGCTCWDTDTLDHG